MIPNPRQIEAEFARRHLLNFIQFTNPEYTADRFHVELCKIMERFYFDSIMGKSPRVIISAPPQHGKTEIVSRNFPAWAMGKTPDRSFIGSTYNQDWANAICGDIQKIMDTTDYVDVFPQVRIPSKGSGKQKRSADYFEVVGRNGKYKAAGRGASPAGRPAHFLIIDDFLKNAEEAMSETIRESCWQSFTQDLRTRVQKGGGIAVMATRWILDDLIGRIMALEKEGGEKFDVYVFPAIAELDTRDWRQPGEALAPSRQDITGLLALRSTLNTAGWSALYQGSPIALSGNILPADKWKYYGGPGQPGFPDEKEFDFVVCSWDGSFVDSSAADFAAGQKWGIRGSQKWLFPKGYTLERMGYVRFKQAIREMRYEAPVPSWVFIEAKANGPAVIDDLKNEISGIIAVEPQGGKIARAWAASSDVCAGNVYLPDPSIAPYIGGFVKRCAEFPANINKAGSDDDIDAFTQMVNEMRARGLGVINYLMKETTVMAEKAKLQKPVTTPQTKQCPHCSSTAIVRVAGRDQCNQCGKALGELSPAPGLPQRIGMMK